MSPNEAQLRAALQHGAGETPDADVLIAHARGVRRERRRRITAIAGGTTLVVAVAAGLTALVGTGGGGNAGGPQGPGGVAAGTVVPTGSVPSGSASRTAASGGFHNAQRAPSSVTGASSVPAPTGDPSATVHALRCPATPVQYAVPGGGATQSGAAGPLFRGTVAAMKVCAYPLSGGPARSLVLTDGRAAALARSWEAAGSGGQQPMNCPLGAQLLPGRLEVLPVAADGTSLRPVVITGGCRVSRLTNGVAVRYVSELPPAWLALFDAAPSSAPSS